MVESTSQPLTHSDWIAIQGWAAEHFKVDGRLKTALARVERKEAREAIYAAAHDIATLGAMSRREMHILSWLDQAWALFE